ncbi:MAG: hypothetical protein RR824_12450, partial [Clostridia bacterium]
MNKPQWFPTFKQTAPAADAPTAQNEPPQKGVGPITGRRLDDLKALTLPFVRDPFFRLRPPCTQEGMELSLELANMTYWLELDPWIEAGWNDFSIQIDNTLQSGMTHNESADGERMQGFINAWKVMRAKASLREYNPVSQVMGALRQREKSDTIKAVCMMHKREGGGYLLAIGFMGTGKRFYDWFSNFRFTTEEGFHKGFFQLCECFEQISESILFPTTAAELGLEKLTLGDVLHEMTDSRSRFRLWMAGHSQGGAVMQIFTHRLMMDWGVLPQNMIGYGFASPTVATGKLVHDPAAYPLFHIINSDDMVPRMGALLHLGLCLNYEATAALRDETYELSTLPADIAAHEAILPFQQQMVDTPSILLYSTALLQCMAEEKGEESLLTLMSKKWSFSGIDRVLSFAGDKLQDLLNKLIETAQAGHIAVTGQPMKEEALMSLRDAMRPTVREIPLRRLVLALFGFCVPPHHILRDQQQKAGAYTYIVAQGMEPLHPFIWVKQASGFPVKRFGDALPLVQEQADGQNAMDLPVAPRHRRKPAGTRTAGPRMHAVTAAANATAAVNTANTANAATAATAATAASAISADGAAITAKVPSAASAAIASIHAAIAATAASATSAANSAIAGIHAATAAITASATSAA